jgi:type I restriction enzyme M protein
VNNTGETDKKLVEKTDVFKAWKTEINAEYTQKINDLKNELTEIYQTRKAQTLADYPIFMAIAEDIGYDATGKLTANNELDVIEAELSKFINAIENNIGHDN